MADSESASSATPQDEAEEEIVDEVAFNLPTDVNVVVALDDAVLESWPVGMGDPFAQGWVFNAETEPPEPLPVE